jgi:hypothetical protein
MRRAALAVATLAVLGGAIYFVGRNPGGDPQFSYGVTNGTSSSIIVKFGSYGSFVVPAGASGRAASTFGTFHQDIEIFDEACQPLQTMKPTAQTGTVNVRDGRAAGFTELPYSDVPTNQLQPTDKCRA